MLPFASEKEKHNDALKKLYTVQNITIAVPS
jgi:hypothetical protein